MLAGEGSDYFMDAILNCNIWVYISSVVIIISYIFGLKQFKERKKTDLKKIIKVNELGSFIWNNLESAKNEDEIVSLVMDKYQVDFNQAKGDVDDFLKYLRDVDII